MAIDKYEQYLAKARERRRIYYAKVKDDPEYRAKARANWQKWNKRRKKQEKEKASK